jgi:hypothetical protein
MKKLFLTFSLALVSVTAFAQSAYDKIMKEKIAKIEACKTAQEYEALSNDFRRIADKEQTKWEPLYYTAFTLVQQGRILMRDKKMDEAELPASSALKLIEQATKVGGDNAEFHIINKMANSLIMLKDPMTRYATYGMQAAQELETAEKMDPTNPRIALLKGEDLYFTPEQFGGSKTKGMEMIKTSLELFKNYKPKSDLAPNWGKSEAEYFSTMK